MPTSSVAVLRITLDDIEPRVERRFIVPANIRLDRLHLVIQAVMGWSNSHLYEIRIGDTGWGEPDPDGFYQGPLDAKTGRLDAALADARRKTFHYIYDFGDNWSHTVKLEKLAPTVEGAPTILLLEAVGRCPPEDCGGAPGYENMLEILSEPDHEEYEDTLRWCAGPFDRGHADLPALEGAVDRLARRWGPRQRKIIKPRT